MRCALWEWKFLASELTTTFGDAAWWAFTTVTTVGYGERYPITGQGQFVAGGLMLAGIALLGIVTATPASWLIDKVREVEEHTQAATRADVVALTAEVHALRQELAARDPALPKEVEVRPSPNDR